MGLLDSLFGSKGTSSSSSQVTMPDWLQQPAQGLVSQATELSKRAYTPYTGQTVAGFSPFQQLGIQQMGQMAQNNPVYGAAQQGLLDTIQGRTNVATNPFAGSNPYLGQQIDAASQDVVRNYNMAVKPQTEAAMVRSGSFGNSGLQQVQQEQQRQLAGELGRLSSGMRFQDYGLQAQLGENQANRMEAERGRQFAALGQAPGFAQARFGDALALQQAGGLQQEQQQRELTDQYGRFMEQQQFPYQQLGFLSSILNPMQQMYRGQTMTGQTESNPGLLGGIAGLGGAGGLASGLSGLGGLVKGIGSLFSDRRVKEDIKRVGTTNGGLPVYTFRYKGSPTTHMGVMAQDVEKVRPDAVESIGGVLAVDYAKVT